MTPGTDTCPETMVGSWGNDPARLWTCGQRAGHRGPHNERPPSGWRQLREAGCRCTAWEDHAPNGCPTATGPGLEAVPLAADTPRSGRHD